MWDCSGRASGTRAGSSDARELMHADVRALKEQEAAAHAIVEARAAAREVLNDSDHDASPQNGFDGISDEAVAEAGYESEESEEEAWWAFSEGPKSAPGP